MRKKVFATSWHPGGINTIVPVIKKLMTDGKADVVVMGHEFSEPILTKAEIPFKTIKDFGVPDISVSSMKIILGELAPDAILMGTASQEGKHNDILEHTLTRAAKEMGIPTLAVLDVWGSYWQRFSDERTGQKFDVFPDVVAVMDWLGAAELRSSMIPEGGHWPNPQLEHRIVVTGNPHFDNLFTKGQSFTDTKRQEIKQKMGLLGDTLFFFAGNGFAAAKKKKGYWDLDIVQLITETMPQLSNVGVVVRLHPRILAEDRTEIARYIKSSGANMKLVADVDSQILALATDLTIVEDSTIGIEAVYMRRPCISLQPGLAEEDSLLISRKNIIPAGYDVQKCKDLLVNASDSEYRGKLLEQSAGFSTDGNATDRVVNIIYAGLLADHIKKVASVM